MIETFIVPAEQLVVWIFSISWIYWLNKPGDWRIHRNNHKLLIETFILKFSTSPTSFRTISVISVIVSRFSVSHPFLKLQTKLMINFKMYLKQGCMFCMISKFSSQWKPAVGKTGRGNTGRSCCTEDNYSLCTLCSSSPSHFFRIFFRALMIYLNIIWV